MELFPKLPPVALEGPRPVPIMGPFGNLMRFFGDPVGELFRLSAQYGDVVALVAKNPAWVCAMGSAYNRQVLADSATFPNFVQIPFRVPSGSAAARFDHNLTSQNGDIHRRNRRMMMPAFARSRIASYRDDVARVTEDVLAHWRPGQTVDMAQEMIELTLRVALRCFFGIDVSDRAGSLGHLAMTYLELILSPATLLFPYRVPGTPYARFLSVAERMDQAMRGLIAARRRPGPGR